MILKLDGSLRTVLLRTCFVRKTTYSCYVRIVTRSSLKKKLTRLRPEGLGRKILNKQLVDWNRCAYFFNLMKDAGIKAATKYAASLPAEDRQSMMSMFERIKNDGYRKTRGEVLLSVSPTANVN